MKITDFPQLIISLDAQRAIVVREMIEEHYVASNRHGYYLNAVIQLRPREIPFPGQFFVSNHFRIMWNSPTQTLRWDEDFDSALNPLAMIAAAKFLDENEVPSQPTGSEYALKISITSSLFSIFQQQHMDDEALVRFAKGKIYWSWKYKLGPAMFEEWEAQRLGVEVDDIKQAAFPNIGSLWEITNEEKFRALPELARQFESKPAKSWGSPTRQSAQYDFALSFAGEQRDYVKKVAAALKDAGASIFYDEFIDLWGKDLTRELEKVYRTQSRYAVVFVSKEYLEKSWPNLERQHALAGRIERQDNSVLPARFDDLHLPGLPSSVGYLDIGNRTHKELADLILRKLPGENA